MQCPICGSTNNIILENNSQKILKLRHPGLLFSNKELANKFNTRCLCPKCNLEFKYNEVTGYSIDITKKMEFGILSALWQYIDKLAHIRMDFAGIMQTIGIKGRYVGFTYIRPLYGFAPFWRS